MIPKGQLESSLKAALSAAERRLFAHYTRQRALPVIRLLGQLIATLNYATHKKSVALFVSPETSSALYFDEPVDKRVLVDSDFRMRDLAVSRDTNVPYFVLLLSGRQSKMYQSDGLCLRLIKSNGLKPVYAYTHQLPEKVANFSDPAARKEDLLDKFLHHMDEGLSTILDACPLPVFVIATDRVAGHFSRITHNARHIAVYIHKNCLDNTIEELLGTLQPYLKDWRIVRQQMALKHVEIALETGKLSSGIEAVDKAAHGKNSRLLVVERDFGVPFGPTFSENNKAFYLQDQVDTIVKKVLENGGQVEWVSEGLLAEKGHIALIRYY
jgi:hypothetical protein